MPIIKIVQGDLLEAREEYIAHQCNCCTVTAHGLSAVIAKKYPWADVYSQRAAIGTRNCAKQRDVPGTIKIVESPANSRKIICMFAQWTPGKPGAYTKYYPADYSDTPIDRQNYFAQCLEEIEKLGIKKVAMPYLIGCGLGGGSWKIYKKMISDSNINIVLYKL